MKSYQVVEVTDCPSIERALAALAKEVERLMENGWKPQGGVSEVTYKGSWCFMQALVK